MQCNIYSGVMSLIGDFDINAMYHMGETLESDAPIGMAL